MISPSRHHLAPISGTISPSDATPLAAAWREISEETTLTPTSLTLLRQGKSYTFQDPSLRREWTVFPFMFLLKDPAYEQRIQLDWEHDAWAWYDPDTVITSPDTLQSPGVPRLAESLRRVYFETDLGPAAGKVLSRGLDTLAHDYESGARQLAGIALQILRDVVAALQVPHLATENAMDEWWTKVRFAAWHLWKNGRESMGAAILSALLAALSGMERRMQEQSHLPLLEPDSWRNALLQSLATQIEARQASANLISRAFTTYLKETFPSKLTSHSPSPLSILTLSESSTIRHCLRDLALESGFTLDLHILESRPLFEGISLAGSLVEDLSTASPGIVSGPRPPHKITLYPDTSPCLAASSTSASASTNGIDLVLLGADRIASSGAVSNKTGSLPAILSAKHVSHNKARVIVLGESEKVAPPGRPEEHVVEDNDPAQVSRAWQAEYNGARVRAAAEAFQNLGQGSDMENENGRVKVEIRNVFFEWVPASLVDVYVTEHGEWTQGEIARQSESLKAEEARLFGSL
jgi:translation initiation factor 2B subunit (eIF-2B alpha/beta/delta family)